MKPLAQATRLVGKKRFQRGSFRPGIGLEKGKVLVRQWDRDRGHGFLFNPFPCSQQVERLNSSAYAPLLVRIFPSPVSAFRNVPAKPCHAFRRRLPSGIGKNSAPKEVRGWARANLPAGLGGQIDFWARRIDTPPTSPAARPTPGAKCQICHASPAPPENPRRLFPIGPKIPGEFDSARCV